MKTEEGGQQERKGGGGENPKSEFERTRDRLLIPDICSFSVNVLLLQMVPLFSLVFDVVVVLLLFFLRDSIAKPALEARQNISEV